MGFSELTMVRAVKKQKYVIPSPDFEQTKFCEKKDKKTKTKVEKKKSDGYSIICLFRVLFFCICAGILVLYLLLWVFTENTCHLVRRKKFRT
jgi:hypothetical protein